MSCRSCSRVAGLVWGVVTVLAAAQAPAQDFDKVEIQTIPVAGNVYMLKGAGGNIGLAVGDDGVFLIDDQFAPLTDKIRAAIAALHEGPVRFVLNTHWHGDHTGGNENLGKAGTVIVAHDNVRVRMSTKQFNRLFGNETPPSPTAALPVVTFRDAVTFYQAGDEIHAFHVSPAHTDGDAIVHFRRANVLHLGDVFFNGMYPFIDVWSGGSVDGVIAACERVLAMIDDDTRLIPGHGDLGGKKELQVYHDMLVEVRRAVQREIDAGKDLEAIQAVHPTAKFDATWGKGFIQPDRFVEILHASLTQHAGHDHGD